MSINSFNILNTRIDAVQTDDVIKIIDEFLERKDRFYYICSTNANNVINAFESEYYNNVMNKCDISLPDSVPFLWIGRLLKYPLFKRCGIEEIMLNIFSQSEKGKNYRHYFYGNTNEVLDKLEKKLKNTYPKIIIAGMYSPPFRELSNYEEKKIIQKINSSNPDFLWVSLGCPRQEKWLYDHKNVLNPMIGAGAGAVFNFLAGETSKAPRFIQYLGLEWIYRLLNDPKKLAKRYCIKYTKFVLLFLIDFLKRI
ncbi:MAG: WecB/TagA/CpsF family glycosyltransferase [Novosphingobium sp.]|jgi:N-acetylglucosaminyldiphosphoundecaprenol N-acetyl-beta-D-mannosaminyltransferase|nr:WecB/TagA/CpsF family glycosyltransferase [Novosphingobium sp.]